VNVGFRPFTTLYLTAAIFKVSQTGAQPYTTQTYGLNWSPLFSGTLMFNFNHTESFRSDISSIERTTSPGVNWKVTRNATLDLSYLTITSSSNLGRTDSYSWNLTLRMNL